MRRAGFTNARKTAPLLALLCVIVESTFGAAGGALASMEQHQSTRVPSVRARQVAITCDGRCIPDSTSRTGCSKSVVSSKTECADVPCKGCAGACNPECEPSYGCCDGKCENFDVDPNNCGDCGTKCQAGQTCSAGLCCASGLANCNNVCVNINTDDQNCGACNNPCRSGQKCVNGTCRCVPACAGKTCGMSDGCGATCPGLCPSGGVCMGPKFSCSSPASTFPPPPPSDCGAFGYYSGTSCAGIVLNCHYCCQHGDETVNFCGWCFGFYGPPAMCMP